jgi:hypothetical protein
MNGDSFACNASELPARQRRHPYYLSTMAIYWASQSRHYVIKCRALGAALLCKYNRMHDRPAPSCRSTRRAPSDSENNRRCNCSASAFGMQRMIFS